jgi:hypothetical protein
LYPSVLVPVLQALASLVVELPVLAAQVLVAQALV